MRKNIILVDFENVQPELLPVLEQEHFKILIFVGGSQTKLPFEIVKALQRCGPRVEYVKISGNGPNALDFHIAYYIGQLAAQDQSAYFHIISKDKGFDPLIRHLLENNIICARSERIGDIPSIKPASHPPNEASPKAPRETLEEAIAKLRLLGVSKPRRLKTLTSTIAAVFKKQMPPKEVDGIISAMEAQGLISTKDSKLTYSLDATHPFL